MELLDRDRFTATATRRNAAPVVNFVVPCFNEQEVLPETAKRLCAILDGLKSRAVVDAASSIYFVDDGSLDATWSLIEALAATRGDCCGIKLSRNRGHQNALLCGLMSVDGDALISLDADLQDDPDIIPTMIQAYVEGHEVVYGVRRRRDTDTRFERWTAEAYYKLLGAMRVQIVFNHADYRLLGRRAIEALREYRETHLFLRGLIPQLGFKSRAIEYDRGGRFAGQSKYPLAKRLSLAWRGVTSFSATPLRLITGAGVLVSLFSVALAVWALLLRLFTNDAVPGWASIVIPVYFIGGIQLMSLGIIGEYLAKVYEASKDRPRFHVEAIAGQWNKK